MPDSHKTGGNFQAGKPDRLRIMPGWHFAYMRIPTRFRSCRSLSFPLSFLVYRERGRILKIAPRTVYKQTQERVSNFIKFFRKALALITFFCDAVINRVYWIFTAAVAANKFRPRNAMFPPLAFFLFSGIINETLVRYRLKKKFYCISKLVKKLSSRRSFVQLFRKIPLRT